MKRTDDDGMRHRDHGPFLPTACGQAIIQGRYVGSFMPAKEDHAMTTMCRRLVAVMLCSVFVGGITAAAADLTVRTYRSFPDRGLLAMYLHGVRKGFMLMNAELEARGQAPVFCLPADLELSATDVIKTLDHLISLLPKPNDVAIEVVLLDGFKRLFPCK